MREYRLNQENAFTINSSGGALLKWKVGDKYIKTSTIEIDSLRHELKYESYAEVIASRIAGRLGFNAVRYDLCKVVTDRGFETIACESTDFKPTGYTEASIGSLIIAGNLPIKEYGNLDNYSKLLHYFQNVPGFKQYIDSLIVLDSLVLNDDRHSGNFGVMLGEKVKPLPIFDTGNSLFCHKYTDGVEYQPDLVSYLKCKPFSLNFDIQLSLVGKRPDIVSRLDALSNYIPGLLYRMTQQGLPKQRAIFIKELLKDRIETVGKILG